MALHKRSRAPVDWERAWEEGRKNTQKSKNSAQAGPGRNTMQEPGLACLPVRTSQPVGKGPGLAPQGNYETGVDLSLQKKESNQELREHRAPFQQPHPRAAGSHRARTQAAGILPPRTFQNILALHHPTTYRPRLCLLWKSTSRCLSEAKLQPYRHFFLRFITSLYLLKLVYC